jgi:hypothetical protein
MKLGKRLFPYPLLNNNPELSTYTSDSSYKFVVDLENGLPEIINRNIRLKNVRFELEEEQLLNLYKEDKLSSILVVECSQSLYRDNFIIHEDGKDIDLPLNKINGNLVISSFLVAKQRIENFHSESFQYPYKKFSYTFDPNDIVAADDGFSLHVDINELEPSELPSIFQVVKKEDAKNVAFDSNGAKINILLPDESYNNFNFIKQNPKLLSVGLGLLAVPALAFSLNLLKINLKSDDTSIDELCDEYAWFRAVCESYFKTYKKELTKDDLLDDDCFVIAQEILGSSLTTSLNDITKFREEGDE